MADTCMVCFASCKEKASNRPKTPNFFDPARTAYGGEFSDKTVDGVIAITRLLPIFFFVIMYWAIYSQVRYFTDSILDVMCISPCQLLLHSIE